MRALSKAQLLWILAAHGFSLLPSFFVLPLWLPLFWFVVVLWRYWIHIGRLGFPRLRTKNMAAAISLLLLAISSGRLLSVESFIHFFALAYSLKLLEMRTRHDGLLMCSVAFIALAAGFLFFQTLWMGLYTLAALALLFIAWVSVHRDDHAVSRRGVFYALGLFAQVLPLMLILFVSMPRLNQLWHMPSQSRTGVTGFSDSMSPGSLSDLIQSDAVAFRVSFESEMPAQAQLYWRALVLEAFDGIEWKRSPDWKSWHRQNLSSVRPHPDWRMQYMQAQERVRYSVLLEPHQHAWLFTLNAPVSAQSSSLHLLFTETLTLRNYEPVAARSEYQVDSILDYRYAPGSLTADERALNLQLPDSGNEQARSWARRLVQQYGENGAAIVRAVLQHYRQQFSYTTRPPLLQNDAVDAFLFQTQRGFCEHFASSFSFMMRAAGLPARVVIGYQGGELHPNGDYLIVRQRDAHAWAEVWLPERGWLRVDPTAAVAPERIESGLREALEQDDAQWVGGFASHFGALAWLQLQLDTVSYQWHRFVLNYDQSQQQHFFAAFLGAAQVWRIAIFFVLSCLAVVGAYFALAYWRSRTAPKLIETRYYRRHLLALARAGYAPRVGETPTVFAQRVAVSEPSWQRALLQVAHWYNRAAYAGDHSVAVEQLRAACRWRPPRKRG